MRQGIGAGYSCVFRYFHHSCMQIEPHIHMHVYIYICVYVHIYVHINVYIYVCMSICILPMSGQAVYRQARPEAGQA